GTNCTLTATTNAGYTWLGWFDGETKVSTGSNLTYTFTMLSTNKTYTAKWSANVYTISLDVAGGNTLQTTEYRATTGAQYTLDVPTRDGYTFRGWAMQGNENTLLTYPDGQSRNNFSYAADITVVAQWQINSYFISTAKNINSAGGITGSFYADYNSQQTITATTNAGYTWLGWFDGETKVSTGSNLTYTFTVPSTNKTYTAKWMLCPVTLSKNIEAAGTVQGVEGATAVGDDCTLTATTNAGYGYTWLGWFDGGTKVSIGSSLTYTFTMPSTSK
ncbi:MAG: InlB B-repeat-containing protein, partial [Clostridia bacterium]